MKTTYEEATCAVCGVITKSSDGIPGTTNGLMRWLYLTRKKPKSLDISQVVEAWVCDRDECVMESGRIFLAKSKPRFCYGLKKIEKRRCDCCDKIDSTDLNHPAIGGSSPFVSWQSLTLLEENATPGLPPKIIELDACSLNCLANLAGSHAPASAST